MIERYSLPQMKAVWSEDHMFELWLRIEIAACEAWTDQGVISSEDMAPDPRRQVQSRHLRPLVRRHQARHRLLHPRRWRIARRGTQMGPPRPHVERRKGHGAQHADAGGPRHHPERRKAPHGRNGSEGNRAQGHAVHGAFTRRSRRTAQLRLEIGPLVVRTRPAYRPA